MANGVNKGVRFAPDVQKQAILIINGENYEKNSYSTILIIVLVFDVNQLFSQNNDKPDHPNSNDPESWEAYLGDGSTCEKIEDDTTPFTLGTAPDGYMWSLLIINAGKPGPGRSEVFENPSPGEYVNSQTEDVSHAITCKLELASVGNFVWVDENEDGFQDQGESGESDVTVSLYKNGDVHTTTHTDENGKYLFTDLKPGDDYVYKVKFELPTGYEFTTQGAGGSAESETDSKADEDTGFTAEFTLEPGEEGLNQDAGLIPVEPEEPEEPLNLNLTFIQECPQPGPQEDWEATWRVRNSNDINVDYTVDRYGSSENPIVTGTADPGDNFFTTEWGSQTLILKWDDGIGGTGEVTKDGGDTFIDQSDEKCALEPASVGNFVWHDKNGNGIQDEGEPGIDGVTINLYDANGAKLETTTTAGGGAYLFDAIDITDINGDEFQIEFELPDGYQFTRPNQGDDPEKDSDAIPGNQIAENDNGSENGVTDVFTLMPGQDRTDQDAGLIETTTTIELSGACYRMLSSPAQTTYSNMLENIWTQGRGIDAPGKENHIKAGEPNVLLWDTAAEWSEPENGAAKGDGSNLWTFPTNLNDEELTAGSGFLLGMYDPYFLDLDDPGTEVEGPYEINVNGNEHGSGNANGVVIAPVNQNVGGWILAGNPYYTSIDINQVIQESSGLNGVIYIWDRQRDLDGFNGWRTFSVGNGNGLEDAGEIANGQVHPYQGFFVQTGEENPELKFTNNAKASNAEFYGKERAQANRVRLKMTGERGAATTWLVFSESGSFDKLSYDAYEMDPMSSEYVTISSRKNDGTLFDIGYYPNPTEDFEIPIAVETSIPGKYTITASDLNLSMSHDLYFVDRETNTTVLIDDSFSYEFSINRDVAKVVSPDEDRCSMGVTQMSKSAGEDRFMITTKASANVDNDLPQDVRLKQNYPNPFNPTTSIQYVLPESANVTLEVFNMLGQRVASIADGQQSAGTHTVDFDASNLTSGVYIYRLTAGSTVINKRMTLVK